MNHAGAAAGRWKRPGVAGGLLAAVLVLALVLRLKGVSWGLPYSFVNVDESIVVPKAFGVARGGLNPQFFYYPSFFFYLVGGVYLLAAPAQAPSRKQLTSPVWQAGPAGATARSTVSWSQSNRAESTRCTLPLVPPLCQSSPRLRLQKWASPVASVAASASALA